MCSRKCLHMEFSLWKDLGKVYSMMIALSEKGVFFVLILYKIAVSKDVGL